MATNTRIPGTIIRSGSIPTTALTGGVVSSSVQITTLLPGGSVSSSGQVTELLPIGVVSSSTQYPGWVTASSQIDYNSITNKLSDVVSSSTQVKPLLPDGTVTSSAQYPGWVTGSSQIDITSTTNYTTFSSSLATADTIQTSRLSALEDVTGSYATTGSNLFVGTQSFSDTTNTTSYLDGAVTVAGGMSVRQDVRVSGSLTVNGLLTVVSMSSQYVTSSQYNVGVSKITLNDDDTVRFAGLSIYDSGSSSPTSASIYWDSLQHRFIYENLSGSSYNSAIIIAGPKNTGSLGDESTLTTGYLPYATGDDHISNSVIYQSGSNVGINTLTPQANFHVEGTVEIRNTLINVSLDNNDATVSGNNVAVSIKGATGNVGVGTTNPQAKLNVSGSNSEKLLKVESPTAPAALFVSGSGNVGIGITTPGAKLHVFGETIIDGGIGCASYGTLHVRQKGNTLNDGIAITSDFATAHRIWKDANGVLNIGGSSNPSTLTITTGGNVGIGTTNPEQKLHINGSIVLKSNTNQILQLWNSSSVAANLGGEVQFRGTYRNSDLDSVVYSKIVGGKENATDSNFAGYMAFSTYPYPGSLTERLRITSDGNVGIGTTIPTTLLHIQGNVYVGSTVDATSDTKKITIQSNGRTGIELLSDITNSAGESGSAYVLLSQDAGNVQGILSINQVDNQDGTGATFANALGNGLLLGNRYAGSDSTLQFGTSGSVRMTIKADGFIGIGKTNPDVFVEAKRTANDTLTRINVINDSNGSSALTILGVGNDTNGSAAGIRLGSSTNTAVGNNTFNIYQGLEAPMTFTTAGVERVRITSAGNVGIGTTNPGYKLVVNSGINGTTAGIVGTTYGIRFDNSGSFSTNCSTIHGVDSTLIGSYQPLRLNASILLFGISNTEMMRIDSSGNVGIGTTNPSYRLHVESTTPRIYVKGTSGDAGIFMKASSSTGGWTVKDNGSDSFLIYSDSAGANRLSIDSSGHVLPGANGTQNLGSASLRWATVYTSDLSLSNGIGDWTIVEGEDDLFIYNNKNNKVYKFTLQEVDPSTATPKKS